MAELNDEAWERWRERLEELITLIKSWVEPRQWVTGKYPKKMRGEHNKVLEVPSLFLQRGPTRLLLDPIAYDAPGTEGIVDLYLMPTYDDMASLSFVDGSWRLHYAFPGDQPVAKVRGSRSLPLDEANFLQILDEIAAHAVPSF